MCPLAKDECARTRQIAQGFQNAFATHFLNDADRDRQRGKGGEDDRVKRFADCKIDYTAGKQEREHRLAHHAQRDAHEVAPVWRWEFVWAKTAQTRRCFSICQPHMGYFRHHI